MRPRAWDEGIGTGIPSIDSEHRLQVGLVNALEEQLREGRDPAPAAATLAQLLDFSRAHFHAEELLMRLHAYPQYDAHALEHGRLLEQLREIERSASAEDRPRALELVVALRSWLTGHITAFDQAFALWCARQGIRPDLPVK